MNVLALETATSVCSVALLQDGRIAAESTLDRPRAHAEHLVPMIAGTLEYAHLEASEITAVAVSSGPGSYTGLRIGVSTAKGLAAAIGAGLISVPSLLSLADLVRPFAVQDDRIAAALDARRDEAFAALYRVTSAGSLRPLRATTTVRPDEAAEWLGGDGGGILYLVGQGWQKMRDRLDTRSFRMIEGLVPSAAPVARIGAARFERGEIEDVVTFEPYYLKEFVATKPQMTAFEKLSF